GLVEHVVRSNSEAESVAWKAIERATAVRQILLEDAARKQPRAQQPRGTPKDRVLPLQVELILLVTGSAPTKDPVRTVLTEVARSTGYLKLIGLSVLEVSDDVELDDAALRRAFAWLLLGASKWFDKESVLIGGPHSRPERTGFELELTDYRTAGKRHFACDG